MQPGMSQMSQCRLPAVRHEVWWNEVAMYNIFVKWTGNVSSWENFKIRYSRRLCRGWGVSQTKLRRRECKEGWAWLPTSGSLSFSFYLFPLIISHISTFCHTQPFPPLSSHLRKKMWFPFSPDFDFLPRGSLLAIPLNAMQWGQSLLSFFLSFCDKNFCDKLCPVLDWHQFLWEREKKRRSRHVSKDRRD